MAFLNSGTFGHLGNATNPGSLEQIKKVSRAEKAKIQNARPNEVSVKKQVFIANGYVAPPTVPIAESDIKPADFYRNGEAILETEDGVFNVAAGSPGTVTPDQGIKYNLLPRLLEDFDDREASIRLVGRKQGSKENVDLIPPYTKFILQSAQESYTERSQIVETFGDYYVFFFGQRPIIYNFSGTLINAKNASWLNDWKFMYQNFLRGTKALEQKARIVLSYGGRQVEGYILSTGNQTSAEIEKGVPFSFQLLLIDEKFINFSNDFGLVVQNGQLSESLSFIDLLANGPFSKADIDRALTSARKVMERSSNAALSNMASEDKKSEIEADFNVELEATVSGRLEFLGPGQGVA